MKRALQPIQENNTKRRKFFEDETNFFMFGKSAFENIFKKLLFAFDLKHQHQERYENLLCFGLTCKLFLEITKNVLFSLNFFEIQFKIPFNLYLELSHCIKKIEDANAKKYDNIVIESTELYQDIDYLLFVCCGEGFFGVIEFLIEKGAKLDKQNTTQKLTPLIYACYNKKIKTVQKILSFDSCGIDLQDCLGNTALMTTVIEESEAITKILLSQNPDLNLIATNGLTALMEAVGNECEGIVKLLIEKESLDMNLVDKHGFSPLIIACHLNNPNIVKLLLSRKDLDPNIQPLVLGKRSALIYCCDERPDSSLIELLLQREDLNVNLQDHSGGFALMNSCSNQTSIDELLERPDLNLNLQNKKGVAALMCCDVGQLRQLISQKSIDINIQDLADRTVLFQACKWNSKDIVELLLNQESIDINCADYKGDTPLHICCEKGYADIVVLLISKTDKIDLKLLNKRKKSPLDVAKEEDHLKIVALLEIALEIQH